jgi:predicted phage-related endonuclease
MTREQFKARATTLQMLRTQAELIKQEIETIEAEIKSDMTATGESVIEDDDYRFRFTDYTTRGLDQKRLKEERPEIYAEYTTDRAAKRFSFYIFT